MNTLELTKLLNGLRAKPVSGQVSKNPLRKTNLTTNLNSSIGIGIAGRVLKTHVNQAVTQNELIYKCLGEQSNSKANVCTSYYLSVTVSLVVNKQRTDLKIMN